jgi:hypothetical protein
MYLAIAAETPPLKEPGEVLVSCKIALTFSRRLEDINTTIQFTNFFQPRPDQMLACCPSAGSR